MASIIARYITLLMLHIIPALCRRWLRRSRIFNTDSPHLDESLPILVESTD